MEATVRSLDNATVVTLSGRLDSNTSQAFETQILGLIQGGATRLALDFSTLEYISSAGLRVLLKTTRELKPAGGKVVLCAVRDYVREVFEMSGFFSIFPMTATVEEALGILAAGK